MPKKTKSPKISPEELLESLRQAEAERSAEEQERYRAKVALEQKEYNQRRMLLMETVKFFRRLEKAAYDHGRQLADRKEWTDFLSCRTSPNPASPPELRECLFRWVFQQEALEKSSVSWTLAADERSPLTQDPGRKRKTRKDLRETFRNMGEIYLPTICEALSVLESIQANAGEGQLRMAEEVALVRDEVRKFISDSLDRMTFRIGSNITRDMETLDPVMSDFHFYADNVLAMYLWSFRPVPLAPDYNLLMKVINIAPLNLVLHRPSTLDLKDCLIRGLWQEFDHFSNMDPTHTVARRDPVPELLVAQETEWNERQEVRRNRLTALRKLREDYENEQRRKQAEAEALEAQKGGPSTGKDTTKAKQAVKRGKAPKQPSVPESVPAVITDETEVDIDVEFERQENDRFWDSLGSVSPKSLPLRPGYINLREYAIVGGVFKLARFDKLPQPVELRPDFIYTNVPVGLKLTEKGYRAFESEELIKIELQLPAHCHWWEAPTVCCWEPWEEGEQFIQLPSEVQQFHLKYDEIEARKATLLFAAPEHRQSRVLELKPKTVQDFSLVDVPVELRLHYLIRDHLLPRVPEGYRFRAELKRLFTILTERAERRKARDREQMARNGMLQKYDQFLTKSHHHHGGPSVALSEMRLPIDSDIDIGEDDNGTRPSGVSVVEVGPEGLQEMDEKLQQFSLAPSDGPRYLHAPVPLCPHLIVGCYDSAETAFVEQEMEALVQRMESPNAMLANDSNEQLCRMFSTFLTLLQYLREKEVPHFPPLPAVEDETAGHPPPTRPSDPGKQRKRRQFEIRTTKKYPLGLGERTRTLSGMSEAAVSLEEKKKRKRKKSLSSARAQQEHLEASQAVKKAPETELSSEETLALIEHEPGRWSTMPIRSQSYDPEQRLLTFYTDRLGVYGLAARKYSNIPFLHWDIRRHGRIANLTTVITISAKALRIVFYVTSHGYRVELQEHGARQSKETDEAPPTVLPTEGAFTLEELEKYLHRINVHVFPQVDTCFYVPGMESGSWPKHPSMETHNLRCLGVFCLTHNFQSCLWNRYANRRTSLVLCRELIEGRNEPEFVTVMITPLKSQHVEVEELCSDTLEDILLAFHPRPEVQSYNADCYGLLKDGLEEPSRKVLAKTPALLQWNVGQLLQKLRLLSYS
uniref:IC97/Casc1 N-terminal domain-containing protein n=1 Tax=Anopheles minimus TaxID=112268 RepID=A0A182VVY3_9DIPT